MAAEDDVRDDAAAPGPSGPAPIIDLGGDAVPVRPVKPLGPRRMARLQRELAERSRELEELGGQPAGPELLEKQRRFAELAAQAAAGQAATDRTTGDRATDHRAAGGTDGPWTPPAGPAAPGAGISGTAPSDTAPPDMATAEQDTPDPEPVVLAPGPSERITVVFPDTGEPDGGQSHVHDPVHVDPALFSNRLSPEELSALTHIEILSPAGPAQQEPPSDAAAGRPDEEAPPPYAGPEEEPAAPAPPVPATRAGGLELLDPGEYRSGRRGPVLVLAVVLAAALIVLLVLFVL
ncbi:hypothetical protein ACH9EU_13915 [Kocuria sp. M1R5S2]|uniref:hypothetical protein n=1 Tax=Kocuria rhizosphaerae TaxID=3376285 RepID=UPI0037B2F9F1